MEPTAGGPASMLMMSRQQSFLQSVAASIRWGVALGALGWVSACGPSQTNQPPAPVAQANAPGVNTAAQAPVIVPPPPAAPAGNELAAANSADSFSAAATAPEMALPAAGLAIDQATFHPAPSKARVRLAYDPALVRIEVLLDRAGFSPGVIDGKGGLNLTHALAAFAAAHGLTSKGALDQGVWNALTGAAAAPTMQTYVITAEDEAGPFIGVPPTNYQALSKLPALAYSTPVQELAERFHMDQGLLRALNPGADFSKAGQTLLVAAPRAGPRTFTVARIEVDKTNNEVRAYGADGQLLAFYPASVGSTERPAPSGVFAVAAVAPHPAYFYDPARLTFAPEGAKGKLRIAPGPNNPVGLTWIALTVPTYGIHGSPDPTAIGKHQSHGCVRLTNWDAVELGKAVKKGVPVDFVGQDRALGAKA
jgi:lipoprotein-anchoring transpeptidase ErfK/SrfK